jgi:hypothetical protein
MLRSRRMSNDWTGNKNSIYKALGASSATDKIREENDLYCTDPIAIDILLGVETFSQKIWEPACGYLHLSNRLEHFGFDVTSTDLIDRGYGTGGVDFLKCETKFDGDIITNPPYKFSTEFVEKGIELTNNKLALFLKVQFLEGKARKKLFEKYPPKVIYVSSSRIMCAKNGDFEGMTKGGGSVVAFSWWVWVRGYKGETTVKWVN